MQAGGLVNVTAREQCIFTVVGTDDATYYFCYDGICTSSTFTSTTYASTSITNIKDENGDSVLSGAVAATKAATAVVGGQYVVNMPMGKSCDGLEMRIHDVGQVTDITKTTRKHNNGKQFKITRSFIQSFDEATAGLNDDSGTNTCKTQIARSVITFDSMPEDVPIVALPCQDLAGVSGSNGGTPTDETSCHALVDCGSGNDKQCIWTHQEKTLNYVSPVGSCSVAETTKGTYESYECSNRGACDGKSGLCTCYEGYSG